VSKNAKARRIPRQDGGAPRLRLIGGGGAGVASAASAASEDAVRDGVVARARDRVASGYYRRPEVVERLVELLWDELYLR
jgi:hypothetical protein